MQPADEFIQVNFLETSDDHGILDPDDLLCDVVDDKEKVLVIIRYLATPHFVNSVVFYQQLSVRLDLRILLVNFCCSSKNRDTVFNSRKSITF